MSSYEMIVSAQTVTADSPATAIEIPRDEDVGRTLSAGAKIVYSFQGDNSNEIQLVDTDVDGQTGEVIPANTPVTVGGDTGIRVSDDTPNELYADSPTSVTVVVWQIDG